MDTRKTGNHPDQRVDELLDKTCLRQRGKALVTPAHQDKDLGRRRLLGNAMRIARRELERAEPVRRRLGLRPRQRVLAPHHGQDQRGDDNGHPEDQKAQPRPQGFGRIRLASR
jgi:hypothetical protein